MRLGVHRQARPPGRGADKESNWLPTPASGNYYMILRMYGPQGALASGDWQAPTPKLVN